nr:metallophosphoesterase [uncultured Holophaga sp.]
MALRMLIFLLVLLGVLCGASAYMGIRTLTLCPPLARHAGWLWSLLGVFTVLVLLTPFLQRIPWLSHRLAPLFWVTFSLFSLASTYLVALLLMDALQGFLSLARLPVRPWTVPTAAVLTVLACAWGAWTALRPVRLRRVEIPIRSLPPALDGFRIVQISDLHLGPMVRRSQVDHLIHLTSGQSPDLIAVTGDLVDAEADGVQPLALRLADLKATHGIFFVTGNHEYYSGAERWLKIIRGMGWTVLENGNRTLEHAGAHLVVAGMPDPASPSPKPSLPLALEGAPAGVPTLLLFHRPSGAEAASRAGICLQLSGHTHGGQYFPWTLLVKALFDHPEGLDRVGDMWIHTSPGTGFWGPPNRFLMPPELTLLVLRRA